MFDKLRQWLGGGGARPTTQRARARQGSTGTGGGARRPARPRPAGASRSAAGGAAGSASEPRPPSAGFDSRGDAPPAEVACPNCGEPMLARWGTTCGKCRPNLVAPKTLFMARDQVALPHQAAEGMTLGWLVVIRSMDEARRGMLVELDHPALVLSRAGATPEGVQHVVAFDDTFMSSGHAVLRRPLTGARTDAFTIRDRDAPGPSANGTFVNSHKLTPKEVVRLADGDVIKTGVTELLFRSLWLPPVGAQSP